MIADKSENRGTRDTIFFLERIRYRDTQVNVFEVARAVVNYVSDLPSLETCVVIEVNGDGRLDLNLQGSTG